MKRSSVYRVALVFGAFAIANPALALRVTNLDTVAHTVTYDAAGTRYEATAAANETIGFYGLPDGFLSLKSANPKPSRGTLHTDGMLSGIVGAARDQNIPAYGMDDYAIWSGGQLLLQRQMRDNGRH